MLYKNTDDARMTQNIKKHVMWYNNQIKSNNTFSLHLKYMSLYTFVFKNVLHTFFKDKKYFHKYHELFTHKCTQLLGELHHMTFYTLNLYMF